MTGALAGAAVGEFLSTRTLQQALATFVGGAVLDKFDKSSQEICACLAIIDQTLVDGFAGRDIATTRLTRELDAAELDLATARTRLSDAKKFFFDSGATSEFAGNEVVLAQKDLHFLEKEQSELEAQLAARAPEVAAARERAKTLARMAELEAELDTERQGILRELETAKKNQTLRQTARDSVDLGEPLTTMRGVRDEIFPPPDRDAEIAHLEARLAAVEEKLLALRVERAEALVEKEAAAVNEAPRAADDLIVPDGRLITGSLVPGAAGGGISIPESAGQAFDALDATLEKVDKSMTTVFDNMAVGGASAADELSRIFASLDSDILGSLGGLGSIISQFFGGGPLKLLGSLFGLAGGGTAQPGIPILVGERGPEIFLPGGPGRVLNGHDSQRAMGGAMGGGPRQLVVQQTINFSTDVKNTVRAEVLNALPLATNIAAQKVSDMLRGIRY